MAKKMTRTEFLGLGGVLAGAAVGCGRPVEPGPQGQATPSATEADVVVVNARVYTIDDALPRVEAFAIKDGKFIATGSSSDIKNLASPRTQIIDAGANDGDARVHRQPLSSKWRQRAVRGERQRPDGQGAAAGAAEKAKDTPPGYWVNAFMFDDTKLDVPLHRKHLDEVVPDHPVSVNHRGGHTSWYNSKALELAGITRQTRDPEHGRFFRDESGELNGRVAELARAVFAKVGKREEFTPEQSRERGKNGMMHISSSSLRRD